MNNENYIKDLEDLDYMTNNIELKFYSKLH
jgi:hypothetical protein